MENQVAKKNHRCQFMIALIWEGFGIITFSNTSPAGITTTIVTIIAVSTSVAILTRRRKKRTRNPIWRAKVLTSQQYMDLQSNGSPNFGGM